MRKIITFLFLLLILGMAGITPLVWTNPLQRAAIEMFWELVLFWIIICGSIMYFSKNVFRKFYFKISWPFWIKFTIFATIFALLEEAIAVAINNSFYATTKGVVGLTASTNYWEVVSRHSIVALMPLFLIMGLVIQKFKLTPFKTFITFGIIGTLAEISIGGIVGLVEFPLWLFVYGLMVYLPAQQS